MGSDTEIDIVKVFAASSILDEISMSEFDKEKCSFKHTCF
jgi:hypothetical protein